VWARTKAWASSPASLSQHDPDLNAVAWAWIAPYLRAVLNAIFYLLRTGLQSGFPRIPTVMADADYESRKLAHG
jgi:hypothetical protein